MKKQICTGLNEASQVIHQNAVSKGFYDNDREVNIGEKLMLIVSEVSEALEADRKGERADTTVYDQLLDEGYTWKDSPLSFNHMFEQGIKNTFEDELADVIIRVLDLVGYLGIDIEKHINAKHQYNSGRERLHGKKY